MKKYIVEEITDNIQNYKELEVVLIWLKFMEKKQ